MSKNILVVIGTRPEAIKMAPVVDALRAAGPELAPVVVATAQHRQMLDQVLQFFQITPDYDFNIMKPGQDLAQVTNAILSAFHQLFQQISPDAILVQGDTTTAFTAALAGAYRQIPVGHVEAGLRSFNRFAPYPEELNRVMISRLAHWHFAPTQRNREHLESEGIREHVYIVGNTVIDALLQGLGILQESENQNLASRFAQLKEDRKLILITGHRRESFGQGMENICRAIRRLAEARSDAEFLYLVHLNPNVQKPVYSLLQGLGNVHLVPPVDYPAMIWLLNRAYLVLTDSGGIQEEAPSLGKPVLVMREVTERLEGIEAGTAKLVGVNTEMIIQEVIRLLDDTSHYQQMSNARNPYGDGRSAEQIVDILRSVI